jgi:glycosyltransferase involved in cell wall biosynthesis
MPSPGSSVKISIITAVLNGRDTIRDTISSVRRQHHPDIEHIVIDGASTDGTVEILESCRDQFSVLVSEKDLGIYDALNKGIGLATGEVVGFLNSDDLFEDEWVISRIAAAFADGAVEAVYGDLVYVDRSDPRLVERYWRAGRYSRRRLGWGWMPPHPTFYARRSVYERLGNFDTLHAIASDYDCMLRFLGPGGIVPTYIPAVLVKMRMGGVSNRSMGGTLQKSREDLRALIRNRVGGVGALVWKNLSKVGQFFD